MLKDTNPRGNMCKTQARQRFAGLQRQRAHRRFNHYIYKANGEPENNGTERRKRNNAIPNKRQGHTEEKARPKSGRSRPHPKAWSKRLEERIQGICGKEDCD